MIQENDDTIKNLKSVTFMGYSCVVSSLAQVSSIIKYFEISLIKVFLDWESKWYGFVGEDQALV